MGPVQKEKSVFLFFQWFRALFMGLISTLFKKKKL